MWYLTFLNDLAKFKKLSMLHPINLDVIYETQNINFSQGIYDDQSKLIFYSGLVGWNKNIQLTGNGGFEAQLDQCINNLKLLLKAQELGLNNVIVDCELDYITWIK